MKRQSLVPQLLPLLFLLAAGCQQGSESPTTTAAPTRPPAASVPGTPPRAAPPESAQHFLRVVRGAWINAAYLNNVVATKSPRLSLAAFTGPAITELIIPAAPRVSDTLTLTLGYTNHEGGSAKLIFNSPTTPSPEFVVEFDEPTSAKSTLRYQVTGPDTLLLLTTPSTAGGRPSITRFRKVPYSPRPTPNELEANMVSLLNHLLFRGSYQGLDSTGRPLRVLFTTDGHVRGLGSHTRYQPQFDFTGPYSNQDYLMLDAHTPRRQDLIYAFQADTLRLYQLRQDTTEFKNRPGRLLYTLVRR